MGGRNGKADAGQRRPPRLCLNYSTSILFRLVVCAESNACPALANRSLCYPPSLLYSLLLLWQCWEVNSTAQGVEQR